MGVLQKKLKHNVIQKYFFLEILINVKAGRVNSGARKVYHGRHGARGLRVGQACTRGLRISMVSGELKSYSLKQKKKALVPR
jgi:hypothetical protein